MDNFDPMIFEYSGTTAFNAYTVISLFSMRFMKTKHPL